MVSDPSDFHRNLQLIEAMYERARLLGIFPAADPLDGLESDISPAKALNALPAAGKARPGT